MANKVLFGLKNVHFAIATVASDGTVSYGVPHKQPGAVNMTLQVNGSVTPFYADNIVYYQAAANMGYTGTLEMALFDEWFKTEVLKEIKDSDGVLIENASATPETVAILYQVEGDETNALRALYFCQIERPSETAATKGETVTPQTATVNITVSPRPDTEDVKASTTVDTSSEVISSWFTTVHERNGAFTE